MREYQLILTGKARDVFRLLDFLAQLSVTESIEEDKEWWIERAHLLAYDMDRQEVPTDLQLRRN